MGNIVVGISDLKVCHTPDTLITYALGSCIGICLLDKARGIAGMSHIMLPDSTQMRSVVVQKMKFADTAVPLLVDEMRKLGAQQSSLTAKIAGGALMFATTNDRFNIGERNIAAVKQALRELKIPIVAEDTGLNYGRTIMFHSDDGTLEVKSAIKGVTVI